MTSRAKQLDVVPPCLARALFQWVLVMDVEQRAWIDVEAMQQRVLRRVALTEIAPQEAARGQPIFVFALWFDEDFRHVPKVSNASACRSIESGFPDSREQGKSSRRQLVPETKSRPQSA